MKMALSGAAGLPQPPDSAELRFHKSASFLRRAPLGKLTRSDDVPYELYRMLAYSNYARCKSTLGIGCDEKTRDNKPFSDRLERLCVLCRRAEVTPLVAPFSHNAHWQAFWKWF